MRWVLLGILALGCGKETAKQTDGGTDDACLAVTACEGGDGCCPAGCSPADDNDCSTTCGNGTVEGNETCDPPESCPVACPAPICMAGTLIGSSANCNAACATTPITACTNGDSCCAPGCDSNNDNDCVPASSPLQDRLVVASITTPAGVIPGISNWRIWGMGSLRIGPVYTVPFADCGTLVGYTTGTTTNPRARVARLNAMDQLVTTYDLGAFTLRGLAAEPDGHFAALLWDQAPTPKSLHVTRFTSNGTAGWTTSLDNALAAPTDFAIGESRLEYGGGKYGAYFHVHGISGFANGHEGDAIHWLAAATGADTLGWDWGCSHSMSELLRFSPAANLTLPVCVTDCYPGTTGSNFPTDSIGGIYLNHQDQKVMNVDGGCNGSVAGELGSIAPGTAGWKLVFNTHQNAATNGQSSYSSSTMNQDIGFVSIANNKTPGAVVWLTTTTGNEANSSIARWKPDGDATEQYVVGWSSGTTYSLARVSATGNFLEGPTTITTAKWGERDDPFRDHLNGDIVWAWFDSAGSTTLKFARVRSGGTATCTSLP
ncbi:MAG TPA: hypothetical protein VFV99_07045 [Kofleriaceae bacterium]|nr:hypothetical protein [Kofleriaceae bacterium]